MTTPHSSGPCALCEQVEPWRSCHEWLVQRLSVGSECNVATVDTRPTLLVQHNQHYLTHTHTSATPTLATPTVNPPFFFPKILRAQTLTLPMLQPLLFAACTSNSHQFYVFFYHCPTGHSSAGLCMSLRGHVPAPVPLPCRSRRRPVQDARPVRELAALRDLSKVFCS